MDVPSRLAAQLDALSAALEDSGDDLHAILSVLTDDLAAAVPSFTGLSVTVHVDGEQVTVQAMDSRSAATSMLLPLALPPGCPGGSHIIFYAGEQGAFAELAAAHADAGLGHGVVLDPHLPPPTAAEHGPQFLAQRSDIDQAIGVLIVAGHPPRVGPPGAAHPGRRRRRHRPPHGPADPAPPGRRRRRR